MTVWDRAYEATPSWEIGRPQGVVIRLAERGLIAGSVLEVGCGTGENVLELARRGLTLTGLDIAPAAIDRARARAAERGLRAEFLVFDARGLGQLGRRFDTILDVGLFHTLQPDERPAYAAGLRSVIRTDGRCLLVCWSNRNPFGIGPARIAPATLRNTFGRGWTLDAIEPERLETRLEMAVVHAWLADLRAT